MSISNIAFLLISFLYISMTAILFFSKRKLNTVENKIFSFLIISNAIGIILDLTSVTIAFYFKKGLLFQIVNKAYLCYLLTWISTFLSYTIHISLKEKISKIFRNIIKVIYFIVLVPLIVFKLNYHIEGSAFYTYGTGATIMYAISALYVVIMVICIFINIKKIVQKKYMPIVIYIVFGSIVTLVQLKYPAILVITAMESFVTVLMYNTIENPDLRLIEQLNIARNQAERANRAKTDFLSSMSHEIRTPLNAIVGLSEDNLSYKDSCPPEVIENSNDIVSASQTLLEIVGNILDINKIEANKMELIIGPYNVRDEITQMCRITETRIGDKPIKFNLSFAPDIPYELNGDKGKVKEIVNNLLSNAIKYTDQGEVNLSFKCINNLENNDCILIITCQDTGRGIKAEKIGRLFDKFDRLDAERNTTTEGTGLGLAITKRLVGMMGGKINVQSQYGKGSIFMIQIHQQISKLDAPTEIEQTNIKSNDIDFGHKRILIVDDNKLNIKVAKKALSSFNFEIDECYDGEECLNKVKSGEKYDLILMDIMMPNMNGEVAFAKLKEIPGYNIPVIALTADAIAGSQEKYMSEGFNDYIAKPFNKEQIKEKLDKIFN
jgi:signal transduction histidine kinase